MSVQSSRSIQDAYAAGGCRSLRPADGLHAHADGCGEATGRIPLRCAGVMAALVLLSLGHAVVRADVVLLQNGGEVRGDIDSTGAPDQDGRLVVRNPHGRLVLDREQVRETSPETDAELEYARRAPSIPDTADAHWELAQWCREHHLPRRRLQHLERIVQLAPDHVRARHALGYSQVRGQWVTRDDYMRSRGYEYYQGRWRLSQEIELMEEREKRELTQRAWLRWFRRWRDRVQDAEHRRQAVIELAEIRDPEAVPALMQYLSAEPSRAVKLLYVECLGRIQSAEAVRGLFLVSLNDPDIEVMFACFDQLAPYRAAVVPAYCEALTDANNIRVNRAALALAQYDDSQAVGPLIDALITTHQIILPPSSPAGTTSTFGRTGDNQAVPGATRMSAGGDSPRVVPIQVRNRQVLEALIQLSGGANLGYDEAAWRHWLLARQDADVNR